MLEPHGNLAALSISPAADRASFRRLRGRGADGNLTSRSPTSLAHVEPTSKPRRTDISHRHQLGGEVVTNLAVSSITFPLVIELSADLDLGLGQAKWMSSSLV